MKTFSYCLFLIFLLVSCTTTDDSSTSQNIDDGNPDETPIETAPLVRDFLFELIDIMQNNSVNRNKIDWQIFKINVFAEAEGAQTIPEAYPAVKEALRLLGDNHSSFSGADGVFLFEGTLLCENDNFTVPTMPSNIGYVKVNFFSGSSDSESAIMFAKEIQNQIESQDTNLINGWIVDLRNNGGGNMWPMLAGIGPVLGNGTAGYFIDPDGNKSVWGYNNGESTINNYTITQLIPYYQLINQNPKVAVLYDNGIASSGEAIAVAFRGRENTKSFGKDTCGLSTANQGFNISDGSFLNLTTSTFADRNQVLYGAAIPPDEMIITQNIITTAIEYLNE